MKGEMTPSRGQERSLGELPSMAHESLELSPTTEASGLPRVMMLEAMKDGGIAHYAFNLSSSLGAHSVPVDLYTTAGYEFNQEGCVFSIFPKMFRLSDKLARTFPPFDNETGLFCYLRRAVKLLEYPINILEALRLAGRRGTDLVHFQSLNEVELLMVLAFKMSGYKTLITVHNVRPRHGPLKLHHRLIYRIMYSACDHLIIHTHSGKNEIAELFHLPREKITVIPHGDYQFFLPSPAIEKHDAKEALGIPSSCKTILFFGAIRPNKGLDVLLRALPKVKESCRPIKLMIVGEPCEEYGKYRSMITSERIADDVFEHLGYVPNDEVHKYFSAADIVALPYHEVTGSGVLQIAYAFGKPVVASNIPGFEEAVEEGKNGLLFTTGNPESLAATLAQLVNDETKTEVMGAHSRQLSKTKYRWAKVAEETLEAYSNIVMNGNARRGWRN